MEWLGEIPNHWNVQPLRRLLLEPLKYGAGEAAELDDPHLPRYVRITDIDEYGRLKKETFRSLPIAKAAPYLLENNDLLFATAGSIGKTFLYQETFGSSAYASYLVRARLDCEIANPKFVSYYSSTQSFISWLETEAVQSTIKNVSAGRYARMPLPVPPIDEQEAIAEYLDHETSKIDELTSQTKTTIERLKEYRTALITAAVTGKIDVRNYQPSQESETDK